MQKLGRLLLAQQVIFSLLVFLIPTQLGYHFFIPSSYIFGIRVDYLAPTVYLTDILIGVLLTLSFLEKFKIRRLRLNKNDVIYISSLLVFAVLNICFSFSRVPSIIKWVKILELFLFALYIKNQKSFRIEGLIFIPLLLSGILFSLIGILQFINQKTLGGVFYYLGERTFNAATPGIALGNYFGSWRLRAYSTFSHPNSFAAFLALLLGVAYFFKTKLLFLKIIKYTAIFLGVIALYLSLSRWAIATILFVIIDFYLNSTRKLNINKMYVWVVVSVVVLSLFSPIIFGHFLEIKETLSETFFERIYLAKRAEEIVAMKPLFGVGLNNFIVSLTRPGLSEVAWMLQPVHNIFLLTLAETGLIGLLGLTFIFWKCLKNSSKYLATNKYAFIFLTLLFVVITGAADHYWLTLQQNQLILALLIGLSARKL